MGCVTSFQRPEVESGRAQRFHKWWVSRDQPTTHTNHTHEPSPTGFKPARFLLTEVAESSRLAPPVLEHLYITHTAAEKTQPSDTAHRDALHYTPCSDPLLRELYVVYRMCGALHTRHARRRPCPLYKRIVRCIPSLSTAYHGSRRRISATMHSCPRPRGEVVARRFRSTARATRTCARPKHTRTHDAHPNPPLGHDLAQVQQAPGASIRRR